MLSGLESTWVNVPSHSLDADKLLGRGVSVAAASNNKEGSTYEKLHTLFVPHHPSPSHPPGPCKKNFDACRRRPVGAGG